MAKPKLTLIEKLEKKITPKMEEKYRDKFDRFARYMGNGIYEIGGHRSTDTRELFLMFVADREKIKFNTEEGVEINQENEE